MRTWDHRVMQTVERLLKAIRTVTQGEPLLVEYRPEHVSPHIMTWHKINYSFQHHDTIRSYTLSKLRARGNRGKRTDFAYMNRAAKYFGYNQLEEHRSQKNKLICLWDASKDGDMFGEHNPCLVLVKYQKNGSELDLKVVFRKRDLLSRMVGNWAMLGQWLTLEAKARGLKPGWIIDYSMDTTYDEQKLIEHIDDI